MKSKVVKYNLKPVLLSLLREDKSLLGINYVLIDTDFELKGEAYLSLIEKEESVIVFFESGEEKLVPVKNLWGINFKALQKEELKIRYPTLLYFVKNSKENVRKTLQRKEEERLKEENLEKEIEITIELNILF